MKLHWLSIAVWALAALGFVLFGATRTIPIGRMTLPREQVVALALGIVILATSAFLWAWMGIRLILRRFGDLSESSLLDHPVARAVALATFTLALLTVGYARFIEPRRIHVERVSIGDQAAGRVRPIRIALISDLHSEAVGAPWTSLAARVNETDPDLVLLLGDTLNRPDALPLLHQTLREMRARHGKYAVRGNWDVWYWNNLPLLRGTGFRWLDGESAHETIHGQALHLVGFPYRDQDDGTAADRALGALPDHEWRVFLYHTPDLVEQVSHADLYLAGHTHGGQVSIPLFGAVVTLSKYGKRFERGLSHVGHTGIYVNPGIGVEPILPVRFGVPPEITLIELWPRR